MTQEEERRIIGYMMIRKVGIENFFLQVSGFQTLNQYLKHYWLWKNREFFEDTDDYKCTENIREIRKSGEKISDSRFEKIVDARNIKKSPAISSPKNEITNLKDKLKKRLNYIMGEVRLPSGAMINGYDLLTCHSDECRKMLIEKGISEYNESSCPLTVDNRLFFTCILNDDWYFGEKEKIKRFTNRMEKYGVKCLNDREIHIIINHGLCSLVYNPNLLFTCEMILERIGELFPYEKENKNIVDDRLESLAKKVKELNSNYPHMSSNNVWIFEQIALSLDLCEREIENLGGQLDKIETKETMQERIKSMKKEIKLLERKI